jgi:glycosyltransferase involved in cell wall biosynthesis
MKTLSILTCTLENRKNKFKKLEKFLYKQASFHGHTQLLANCDNGEKSIGEKRNELLCAAKGDYVVFVDDDDWVSDDYVSRILLAINYKNPDCCGIEGLLIVDNLNPIKFIHSLRYKEWRQNGKEFERTPNHINPIKRELALSIGFNKISHGEDHDFSKRIQPILKTEVFISNPLYFYKPFVNI